MFEMILTVIVTVGAALYGLSQSIFMNGPHQHLYRMIAVAIIILFIIVSNIHRIVRNRRIKALHVNLEDYLYYHKFTSPLYRAGYLVSYFIQNILFDYTYMRRNFNFCKGLNVYDDNVTEYYIKFRNTWYKYSGLLVKKHRISVKRLRAFAAEKKNEMIFNALETADERNLYIQFRKDCEDYYLEHGFLTGSSMSFIPNHDKVHQYYQNNLARVYDARHYVERHEDEIKDLVGRKNARDGADVNDFKKWIR